MGDKFGAGVANRVRFGTAATAEDHGGELDLVTMFDCLHGIGDPVGAAKRVRKPPSPDGASIIVEPMGDQTEDNLNPISRPCHGFSTPPCKPASLSRDLGLALGAQAGEARIAEVVRPTGLTSFSPVADTPFNLVFEARS